MNHAIRTAVIAAALALAAPFQASAYNCKSFEAAGKVCPALQYEFTCASGTCPIPREGRGGEGLSNTGDMM